jgi:hypothetical protein
MLNDKPCGKCKNFDRIIFGNDTRKSRHGWCAVNSVYPFKEQAGQTFPRGVKRAAKGALAAPTIVATTETVTGCSRFSPN